MQLLGNQGKGAWRSWNNEDLHDALLMTTYQNDKAVRNVKIPVIIMSLGVLDEVLVRPIRLCTHHCHGSNPFVFVCKDPKLINPVMIWAGTVHEKVERWRQRKPYLCHSSRLSCYRQTLYGETEKMPTHTSNQLSRSAHFLCRTSRWQSWNQLWLILHTSPRPVGQQTNPRSLCMLHDSTGRWPIQRCLS